MSESLRTALNAEPVLSLRGDPGFSAEALSEQEQVWYERLWEAVEHPEQHLDAAELAATDDEYQYARSLFEHNAALLFGLRATGDLRFLDAVDSIAQTMRGNLRDGWCDGRRGEVDVGDYETMRARDGYLNFRRRQESDNVHYCRDTSDLEETLMHGHLAMLMYAYHVNRDLESPAGIDYGERADYWLDYLLNHFEPKWRERSATRFPDMDFIDTKFCHTYNVFLLYHYYLGKRLQDDGDEAADAYLAQAARMTDAMIDTPYRSGSQPGGFVQASTPLGPAVVYSFGSPQSEPDETRLEACPVMYSRYVVAAAAQLRLENFYRWDAALLERISTGVAHFVMSGEDFASENEIFTASVGGASEVGGIPPTTYRDPLQLEQYSLTLLPVLAAWDSSGRISENSRRIYEEVEDDVDVPQRVMSPAAFLLVEALRSGSEVMEPD